MKVTESMIRAIVPTFAKPRNRAFRTLIKRVRKALITRVPIVPIIFLNIRDLVFPEFVAGLAAEMGEIKFCSFGINQGEPAKAKNSMKTFCIPAVL